jgi:hypothetical protein
MLPKLIVYSIVDSVSAKVGVPQGRETQQFPFEPGHCIFTTRAFNGIKAP